MKSDSCSVDSLCCTTTSFIDMRSGRAAFLCSSGCPHLFLLVLAGSYQKSCTECQSCPAGYYTSGPNHEYNCHPCYLDCKPGKETIGPRFPTLRRDPSLKMMMMPMWTLRSYKKTERKYAFCFSVLTPFPVIQICKIISVFHHFRWSYEGGSELHQEDGCEVRLWRWFPLHRYGPILGKLQILWDSGHYHNW